MLTRFACVSASVYNKCSESGFVLFLHLYKIKKQKVISRYKMELMGLIAGAVGGWCYWYFVGCASGSCPITSSPYISTVYGAVMGALLLSIIKKSPAKADKDAG